MEGFPNLLSLRFKEVISDLFSLHRYYQRELKLDILFRRYLLGWPCQYAARDGPLSADWGRFKTDIKVWTCGAECWGQKPWEIKKEMEIGRSGGQNVLGGQDRGEKPQRCVGSQKGVQIMAQKEEDLQHILLFQQPHAW